MLMGLKQNGASQIWSRGLSIVVCFFLLIFAARLAHAHEPVALPDFDHRATIVARDQVGPNPDDALRTARRMEATDQLRTTAPSVAIDWDPLLMTPGFVRATQGFLSGPDPVRADPLEQIDAFLSIHKTLFGCGSRPLERVVITRDAITEHNGLRTLWLQQVVGEIPIFGCDLRANITSEGRLVTIGSRLLDIGAEGFSIRSAEISDIEALRAAAACVQIEEIEPLRLLDEGAARRFTSPGLKGEAEVTDCYIPFGPDEIRSGKLITLRAVDSDNLYEILIDATSGEAVLRRNATRCVVEPATYRVFLDDSPRPFSPGPPIPNGFQPPLVDRTLITIGALDPEASPEGWIPAGSSETAGNNVRAHTDVDSSNSPDLPRPNGGPRRVFDFPFNPGAPVESNAAAAVTQAFYIGNWFHDVLYGYGFTEPYGNYQESNFGRGGVESDPIFIDIQDGGGTNNARFISLGADGSQGRVEMYLWSNNESTIDSAFDNQVLIHELAHGVSLRLHNGLDGPESIGMSEGWSDYYALAMLSEPGDNIAGVYPFAPYLALTQSDPSFVDNYYFGIRRYPYSIDFDVNPLTYADMDPTQFDVGIDAPRNPTISFSNPGRAHQIGEIWCQALWECRAELMQVHGFAGNEMMLRLVTDGMKLTTTNLPGMVAGRDAILLADLINYGGENQCRLWDAFARRGLGAGASPPVSGLEGVVESFVSPSDPSIHAPFPPPTELRPGVEREISVAVSSGCSSSTDPELVELRTSINGGPFVPTIASLRASGLYSGNLPALMCGDRVEYYFTVEIDGLTLFAPPSGAAEPYSAIVETPVDLARVRASDREPSDFFGFDLDLDGTDLVVGAFQEDESGFDAGAVYHFQVDALGGWNEAAKLMHPTGQPFAGFGYGVSIDGDNLVIGAVRDNSRASNAGAAYVYGRVSSGEWVQSGLLTALDGAPADLFGASVDVDGDRIVVGSPGNDTSGTNAGAVYVYSRDAHGVWSQERRILANGAFPGDASGHAVSLCGDTLAFGAPGHINASGAVFVYQRQPNGAWVFVTKLTAPEEVNGARFGEAVHLNGDRMIIGAIVDHDFFNTVGAAYIFRRDHEQGWVYESKLTTPDQHRLDEFGSGVAIEGNIAVVGAARSDAAGEDSGAVYSFLLDSDGVWDFQHKMIPAELSLRSRLGASVAISEGLVASGAWIDGEDGAASGAAYLLRPVALDCDANGVPDACQIASGGQTDLNADGVPDDCQCLGDTNGDGLVDTADLGTLIASFGASGSADLNGDTVVDQADLAMLLQRFGQPCHSE